MREAPDDIGTAVNSVEAERDATREAAKALDLAIVDVGSFQGAVEVFSQSVGVDTDVGDAEDELPCAAAGADTVRGDGKGDFRPLMRYDRCPVVLILRLTVLEAGRLLARILQNPRLDVLGDCPVLRLGRLPLGGLRLGGPFTGTALLPGFGHNHRIMLDDQ